MIEVREGSLGKGVFASEAIEPGTCILRGWGHRVPMRTQHSLQVDHDHHIVIRGPIELINHSCEPNCGVLVLREQQVMEIHALRRIRPGEELFTDYSTFELEIHHMPGRCLCGSDLCRGRILGYLDLPDERREAYGPYIAEYLREVDELVERAS